MARQSNVRQALRQEPFPHDGSFREQALFLLQHAILAPSSHNTQPWQFRIDAPHIEVYADRSRALPVVDPHDRELVISCGSALGVLEIAAGYFGVQVSTSVLPEPDDQDLVARVHLAMGDTGMSKPMFQAIFDRHTTRAAYDAQTPSDEMLEACREQAAELAVNFRSFMELADRRSIASLVAEGDRLQFEDASFRRELALWVRSSRDDRRDGLSGTGFGVPDFLSPVGQFVIRSFDIGNGIAASDQKKIMSGTPALGLLSTASDEPVSWINTGRALAHVLLRMTAEEFTASFLNQPVEVPSLRRVLGGNLCPDEYPQILIRFGHCAEAMPPTVRRDIADVLLH